MLTDGKHTSNIRLLRLWFYFQSALLQSPGWTGGQLTLSWTATIHQGCELMCAASDRVNGLWNGFGLGVPLEKHREMGKSKVKRTINNL